MPEPLVQFFGLIGLFLMCVAGASYILERLIQHQEEQKQKAFDRQWQEYLDAGEPCEYDDYTAEEDISKLLEDTEEEDRLVEEDWCYSAREDDYAPEYDSGTDWEELDQEGEEKP